LTELIRLVPKRRLMSYRQKEEGEVRRDVKTLVGGDWFNQVTSSLFGGEYGKRGCVTKRGGGRKRKSRLVKKPCLRQGSLKKQRIERKGGVTGLVHVGTIFENERGR